MPTPFPSSSDTDLAPPDCDEGVLVSRGLASASSGPGGLTPLQDTVLSAITKAMIGFEVDCAHLDPITPVDFADGLARRDEAFRTDLVLCIEIGLMIFQDASVEVADQVIEFARKLSVDSERVHLARDLADGSRQLVAADFDRTRYRADLDLSAFTPLRTHDDTSWVWTNTVDSPELAQRWRSLGRFHSTPTTMPGTQDLESVDLVGDDESPDDGLAARHADVTAPGSADRRHGFDVADDRSAPVLHRRSPARCSHRRAVTRTLISCDLQVVPSDAILTCIMQSISKPITVIGSAAFLGVMLTIGLGLVPFFYLADQSAFEDWFAEYFVFFLPAVFITSVPALIGSITLTRRSAKGSQERRRWRNTLLGLVSVYGVTTAVHLPLNIAFWSRDLTDSAFDASLGLWTAAHILRIAGAGFAAYSAFQASQLTKWRPT